MKQKYLLAATIAIILMLAGAAWFVFGNKKGTNQTQPAADNNIAQIDFSQSAFTDPAMVVAEKMPETNPFKVETNPYESYTNPFNQ